MSQLEALLSEAFPSRSGWDVLQCTVGVGAITIILRSIVLPLFSSGMNISNSNDRVLATSGAIAHEQPYHHSNILPGLNTPSPARLAITARGALVVGLCCHGISACLAGCPSAKIEKQLHTTSGRAIFSGMC